MTDAKGEFTITGLGPGHYAATATKDIYVPDGDTQFDLADRDVTNLQIKMRRGVQIVGHVEPRQPCEVAYEVGGGELGGNLFDLIAPVTTGADGVFRLRPASPGKATLSARCSGGDQGSMPITVAVGMPEVVVRVSPGASIAGRVVDGGAKPVGGVTVMGTKEGSSRTTLIVDGVVTSGVEALTSTNGAYTLNALEAGTYVLRVLDRGRPVRMRGNPVRVKIGAAEKVTGVEVAIDRPKGVIKGVVTGPDGNPLADAWVTVHHDLESVIDAMGGRDGPPPDAEGEGVSSSHLSTLQSYGGGNTQGFSPVLTDAQGRFEIGNLPPAKYEAIAEAQAGKLRGRLQDITPDATVTIPVVGVTMLSGTVSGAKGPAALFTIELDGPTRAARAFTDGKFLFGRVAPGAYTLRVSSRDGNTEVNVTVLPGQPANVDVTLAANAVVVGKLVDPQGKPFANVGVMLIPEPLGGEVRRSPEESTPTSGPDGTFRLEANAGKWILLAMTPPRPFTKSGLVLVAAKTLDLGTVTVAPEAPPKP